MDPSQGESDVNKSEGRIVLNLTNFAQYGGVKHDQEVFSDFVQIRALPWRLYVNFGNFGKKRYLGLFLKCNDKCTDVGWSCSAKAKLRIHSMAKGKEDKQFEIGQNFNADHNDLGSFRVEEFEVLANPQNGWLDDEGAVMVSADVVAEPAQGIHIFTTSDTLHVNGQPLKVNKNQLLFYAPSFGPYFGTGPNAHRGVHLDEPASVEHLKRLIAALPPNNQALDDGCIEGVLHVASRFAVGHVEGFCRNFLAKNCHKSTLFKYRLATKYGFELLKKRILSSITKKEMEANFVENIVEYAKLDKDAADGLKERLGLIFDGAINAEGAEGDGEPSRKRSRR